jgi:hypothetical protein
MAKVSSGGSGTKSLEWKLFPLKIQHHDKIEHYCIAKAQRALENRIGFEGSWGRVILLFPSWSFAQLLNQREKHTGVHCLYNWMMKTNHHSLRIIARVDRSCIERDGHSFGQSTSIYTFIILNLKQKQRDGVYYSFKSSADVTPSGSVNVSDCTVDQRIDVSANAQFVKVGRFWQWSQDRECHFCQPIARQRLADFSFSMIVNHERGDWIYSLIDENDIDSVLLLSTSPVR